MRAVLGISILTFVTVSACGRREPSSAESSGVEGAVPDLNAIHGDFIAALKKRHWSDDDGFETCVLGPETTVDSSEAEDPSSLEWLHTKLPGLGRDTYDSFWSENNRPRPIRPVDRGAMKLRLLTKAEDAELKAILDDDARYDEYWNTFRARYGNAVRIHLSAPGFSKDGKQALINYVASFDFLAAWGAYCLLTREGDRWVIAGEHVVWES